MNLLTTLAGSLMEGFLPAGWDLARIDACCAQSPADAVAPRPWWHERFEPIACRDLADFDVVLGHEIALTIRRCRDHGRPSALILPVGPMGMYRWAVYFLKEWGVSCNHVHGFNMDGATATAGPCRRPTRAPFKTRCKPPSTDRSAR
jgi:glucosamine-6-phosphate deaminase